MRSNSHPFVTAVLALCLAVSTANVRGQAQTVGQLLKLDGAIALEHMREKWAPAPATPRSVPLATPSTIAASAIVAPHIEVLAILGLRDRQRADIVLNGRTHRLVAVGGQIDKWRLVEIQGGCVRLVPHDAPKSTDMHQCIADASPRQSQGQASTLTRSFATTDATPLPTLPATPSFTTSP